MGRLEPVAIRVYREARFMPRAELDGLIAAAMPGWPVTCEARIPPRRANLLLTLRRPMN